MSEQCYTSTTVRCEHLSNVSNYCKCVLTVLLVFIAIVFVVVFWYIFPFFATVNVYKYRFMILVVFAVRRCCFADFNIQCVHSHVCVSVCVCVCECVSACKLQIFSIPLTRIDVDAIPVIRAAQKVPMIDGRRSTATAAELFVEEKWLVTGVVNTLAGWQVKVSYARVCAAERKRVQLS